MAGLSFFVDLIARVDVKTPLFVLLNKGVFVFSLTMTYFHEGGPHYHRRVCVSRSCSGWEGVVPQSYGRQTLTVIECFWSLDIGRSVCCVIGCCVAPCLFLGTATSVAFE